MKRIDGERRAIWRGFSANVSKTHTYLRPNQLGQTADELWSGVYTEVDGFQVHDLADVEPESGFETLEKEVSYINAGLGSL